MVLKFHGWGWLEAKISKRAWGVRAKEDNDREKVEKLCEGRNTSRLKNSDDEILSIQEKDFRLLMIKMMQDIGNKLEAKMDNLQETLTKEIQDIQLKQERDAKYNNWNKKIH